MKYGQKYKALHLGAKYKIKEYDGSWREKAVEGNYGDGSGWKTILKQTKKWISENPASMILDYGCGSAKVWHSKKGIYNGEKYTKLGKRVPDRYDAMTLMEFLGENVAGFYRYDPCHPIYHVRPPQVKFDMTVCTDVVEHVPIEELPALLRDLADLTCTCGVIVLSIPNSPSHAHFMDGENMHVTLMHPKEWKKLIRKYIPKHKLIVNFTK